eukprot:CAMPEP_0179880522 /NCGR_PEP_ID=MMETSP0982-20121206/26853_1 /TAXON_ID=483367 /ORGANISM="non described non described, Strain CCMP 2436" /LENGTH=279 /DNA_ID=CAMNT_0021774163 /DNA_START=39 /DNA_END=875 /DNA_ORIENTATION=-
MSSCTQPSITPALGLPDAVCSIRGAERRSADGQLVLDGGVQLEHEAVGEREKSDEEALALGVAQEARADERVQQQLLERARGAQLEIDGRQRSAERRDAADVGVGRVGAERAHEYVRDRLRHERLAARPISLPPLLAQPHDRVLKRRGLVAVELENDVVQAARRMQQLRHERDAVGTDSAADQPDYRLELADGACVPACVRWLGLVKHHVDQRFCVRREHAPQLLHLTRAHRLQLLGRSSAGVRAMSSTSDDASAHTRLMNEADRLLGVGSAMPGPGAA